MSCFLRSRYWFQTQKEVIHSVLTQVNSMSLFGLTSSLIHVQVDVSSGLPTWDIVGLPDTSVKEAKQRVRAALKNIGFSFPSRRITINLAPAHLKKEGSCFDLPIAIGILCDFQKISKSSIPPYLFLGELSLDGSLNPIQGILPMCTEAYAMGFRKVILPYENRLEAGVVQGLEIYPAHSLLEILNHFQGISPLARFQTDCSSLFTTPTTYPLDFADVKGHAFAKRALEIAAAGGHNCLLIGSPGCGKTMMAKCFPSILPDLTWDEALEVTKIHSIAGTLPQQVPLLTSRPFRSPHHTISKAAFVGGGKIPKPRRINISTFWCFIFR